MRFRSKAVLAKAVLVTGLALTMVACTTDDGSNTASNLFFFNKTEAPEVAQGATEAIYCPRVNVFEGGAHMPVGGGGQATIADLARECHVREDGSVLVKVGVSGRVVSGGTGGRYSVPVQFRIKAGDTIVNQRALTATAAPSAETPTATFAVVQEGLVVPAAYIQSFGIEVGLGNGRTRARAATPVAEDDGWGQ